MKMLRNDRLLSVVAGVCFVFFTAFPAMAQEEEQQQGQPGGTESQPQISDADLEKAAQAYVAIQTIVSKFQQSVQQTEDQAERQGLQAQANGMMVQAIEKSGLDVGAYNNIMAQVRDNKKVHDQLMEKLQKMQQTQ